MRISVILATYRQPVWLEKALWGYAAQTRRDFELLVADDGSGPATAEVVRRMRPRLDGAVRHLWQPDRGFRKCLVLNRAVVAARGDYLIFSDGDCIPRADFVATHARLAERGRYLSGGALRMPAATSRRITPDDIRSGRAFRLWWLLRRGWRPGHRLLRLTRRRRLAAALDAVTPTPALWNGGNASTSREAVVAVNGFDAEMGYKGEDGAFGNRLVHLGLRGRQVRHRTPLLHLDHERPWATPEALRHNREIRRRIRERREVRARDGIEELGRHEPAVELGDEGPPGGADVVRRG